MLLPQFILISMKLEIIDVLWSHRSEASTEELRSVGIDKDREEAEPPILAPKVPVGSARKGCLGRL